MSKFLPQKRKLLEDVFEKASNDTPEKSFSGITKHLERSLKDDYQTTLSHKSFETYYKSIVEKDGDYNIKTIILDDLSKYLEYDSFRSYCMDWKTIEYTINQTVSKVIINITNKPIFTMPDFMKRNGLGILEMAFVLLLVTGGVFFSNGKAKKSTSFPLGFMSGIESTVDKSYMYWDGEKYIATDSSYISPEFDVVAMNEYQVKFLRRITRKDTMTVENSLGKTWYSKCNGEVEFFTADGTDPDTKKELKKTTSFIIDKYAGKNSDSLLVKE